MKVSTDLFIMGIMLGWGPCLAFCSPILGAYIAGTQNGWIRGLLNVLIFSVVRVVAYAVLSVLSFFIGHMAIRDYYESRAGEFIYLAIGIVVIILGLLLVFNKSPHFRWCNRFLANPFQSSVKGVIILGLIIGFAPCIPLFGVLAYIAVLANNTFQAIFYAGCFGAGTILTPLILIGVIAGGVPNLIFRSRKVFDIFSRACGGVLVYFGIKLIS